MRETVVVGLVIQSNHKNYSQYHLLSAKEQVDFVCKNIKNTCDELSKIYPDAIWVFAWREFGITNNKTKFLDKEEKSYLKNELTNIARQYPNVTVISGAIASKKKIVDKVKQRNRLEFLDNIYKENHSNFGLNQSQSFFAKHCKGIDLNQMTEFYILRNTSYIITGKDISRHDKITPHQDDTFVDEVISEKNSAFQPGNNYQNTSIVNLEDGVKIGIETCLEHKFHILKSQCVESGPVFLHLIMSKGAGIDRDNISGKYVLLLDDYFEFEIIDALPHLNSTNKIICYQKDILDDKSGLIFKTPILLNEAKTVMPELIAAVIQENIVKFTTLLKDESIIKNINNTWHSISALSLAVANKNDVIVEQLLKAGADPNTKSEGGAPLLLVAILDNNEKHVAMLLDAKANPNETWDDRTMLSWALELDNSKIIELLTKQNAALMPTFRL